MASNGMLLNVGDCNIGRGIWPTLRPKSRAFSSGAFEAWISDLGQSLVDHWTDFVTDQFECPHHMFMVHAEPLDSRDEMIAAGFLHQTRNLFSAFFRCTDDEAIVDQSIEFGSLVLLGGHSIGHSEAAKNLVAGRNRRSNISDSCFTVCSNNYVAQHWEI